MVHQTDLDFANLTTIDLLGNDLAGQTVGHRPSVRLSSLEVNGINVLMS